MCIAIDQAIFTDDMFVYLLYESILGRYNDTYIV